MRAVLWALTAATLLGAGGALAGTVTVDYPYLDINQQGTDLGVADSGGVLSFQATADAIILSAGNSQSLTPAATFTLTASYLGPDTQSGAYDFGNGTLTVSNGGSSPLLTASFNDLVLQTGLGAIIFYTAPLTYTGGSLAGTLPGGEMQGSFVETTGTSDLSQSFTGNQFTAKVGAVVPLPPGLPLMLSGLGLLLAGGWRPTRRGLGSSVTP